MEPADITILAIQNPGSEATIIASGGVLSPTEAVQQYGSQIEHGAFVALTDRSVNGNTVGVTILVADRETDGILYLQDNSYMDDGTVDVDEIGAVIGSGDVPLVEDTPSEELETFTVFGNNDDAEDFVAVVSATEETVYDVGVKAGLVDEGFEDSVEIRLILKGDQSDLEIVSN